MKNALQQYVEPTSSWMDQKNYIQHLFKSEWYKSLFILQSSVFEITHRFFSHRDVSAFVFPISTGSVSSPMGKGSDSLPVKIKLREQEVYLADSMQFSLEVGSRFNKNGCYYIMPTFRGEKTDSRHLNEFVHIEAEVPGRLQDVKSIIEDYIVFLMKELLKNHSETISKVTGDLSHIKRVASPDFSFKSLSYLDALNFIKLKQQGSNKNLLEDIDTQYPVITSEGEKILLEEYGDFIWLEKMPWDNVPFYQASEDKEFALCADLLAGIGEILGCGQRVNTAIDLEESLLRHGVSIDGYEWYRDMRKLYPMQTSGFGLGVERFILWLTQKTDIRDCALLYRDHDFIYYP